MSFNWPHDRCVAGTGPHGTPLKQLSPPPTPVPWNLSAKDEGSRWPDTVEHCCWKSLAESMLVPRLVLSSVNWTRPPITSGEKKSPCLVHAMNSSGSTSPACTPFEVCSEFVKMPNCPVDELPVSM